MRKLLLGLSLALAGSTFGAEIKINFGDFAAGQTPTNFSSALAGGGAPGDWKIINDEVPSSFAPLMPQATPTPFEARRPVLAQLSQDPTDEHFPMFIYDGQTFRNFKLMTQFKIISGVAEQMAGVVFRFQNASNFYVLRVSALGHNLRFYKVVNGLRGNPVGPTLDITTGVWHTLAVQCDGQQFTCWFDNQLAMPPLQDTSFSIGKIGFWTKSDSVTYFGDTTVDYTPIVPAAQALVDNILKKYPRILGLRIYTPDEHGQLRVLASKNKSEIGMPGTDAEKGTFEKSAIFYGQGKGTVAVDMPLNDRNGDAMATVRVELKSYALAETQNMVLDRVRIIINEMQKRVLSKDDLIQ
jgi:hypothetical protein